MSLGFGTFLVSQKLPTRVSSISFVISKRRRNFEAMTGVTTKTRHATRRVHHGDTVRHAKKGYLIKMRSSQTLISMHTHVSAQGLYYYLKWPCYARISREKKKKKKKKGNAEQYA